MQRLFTGFPSRVPGIGLLVLRFALALRLIVSGTAPLVPPAIDTAESIATGNGTIGALLIASGVLVGTGFLAPFVNGGLAVVFACMVARRLTALGVDAIGDVAAVPTLEFAIAAGLALIGPGAYSIDARLFGRREVIIPAPLSAARPGAPAFFDESD